MFDFQPCHLLFVHFQFTLIHGPNIPGSYAILYFTGSDFTSITSHIHHWALFLLWLHLFIFSGVISPLFSSSIFGTYQPREFIFQCRISSLFILFMGFSRQEYWSGLPFPSPMDHVLSELSTMTRLSWVALHIMAHSFLELDRLCFGYLMDLPIKHFQKFCITFIYLIYFTSLSLKIVWLMNFPRGNNSYKFNILNLNATKLKFS